MRALSIEKNILLCVLALIFIVNCAYAQEYKIIKVVDGDTVYADFNNDGFAQKEERVRLNGIDSFETKSTKSLYAQMYKYDLSEQEALYLGNLGKKFAEQNLLNKCVEVVYSAKIKCDKYNRPLVSIFYDGKNYEEEILKAGLATVYKYSNIAKNLYQFENLSKISQIAKQCKNAKVETKQKISVNQKNVEKVILNQKRGIYHKIGCEYGEKVYPKEYINLSEAKNKYIAARCCFGNNYENFSSQQVKEPLVENDGSINIYFVDPVNKKSPKNSCENESCKSLLNLINNAKCSIDFAIYGIVGQDKIFNALTNAQKRGVKIRGVVDMNADNKNPYPDTWRLIDTLKTVKTDYMEMDFNPSKDDYKQIVKYNIGNRTIEAVFVNRGIRNYAENIMHNKYFIVDNKYVYTGSMNISSTCTNYNSNVSVLIKSPNLAAFYLQDFKQMYEQGKFHNDKQKISSNDYFKINENTSLKAFFLPESTSVYYEISNKIKNAKKYIYVPIFFFTHSRYPQDLIDAHNRGVDVKVIVDATSARTGYSKHKILRIAGIPVKVENWGGKMHMKSMIIDDEYVVIGSMNFTGAAQYRNDENTLLIKNSSLALQFKDHFLYLWNSIPDKWLYADPRPESPDSPGSCSDGIDNNHNGLIDMQDPDCNPDLKGTIKYFQEGPVEN